MPGGGFAQPSLPALGEMHHPLVVAEVVVEQLRKAVEPEPPDNQAVEVADQEVRQEKAAGLLVHERIEALRASQELVAVGARQAFDPGLLEHRIERPTGAAVAVADQHPVVAALDRCDLSRHRRRNPCGAVVQVGWQTIQLEMSPAVYAAELNQFPGDGSASDDAEPSFLLLPRERHVIARG